MKQRNPITASITTQGSWIFGAALPSCDRPYGVMGAVGLGARTA